MVAINIGDVLMAEHEVMHEALTEWVGLNTEHADRDLQYLWGIHDLADKLIKELTDNADRRVLRQTIRTVA